MLSDRTSDVDGTGSSPDSRVRFAVYIKINSKSLEDKRETGMSPESQRQRDQ